jgi:cytidine deaminase
MSEQDLQSMITMAIAAAEYAYIPYSHYPVGAALRAKDGRLFTGCNVENAAYPATICGERTALVKAVSEGVREFECIVVATRNAGSPCGMCRQMMFEFAPEMRVLLVDFEGKVRWDGALQDLLPLGFGPNSL